jgi:hypothetical protein
MIDNADDDAGKLLLEAARLKAEARARLRTNPHRSAPAIPRKGGSGRFLAEEARTSPSRAEGEWNRTA